MENFWASIRQNLTKYFSESDIKNICFDFGIEHENLEHEKKGDLARDLLAHVQRHFDTNQQFKFYNRLKTERENSQWPSWPFDIYNIMGQPEVATMPTFQSGQSARFFIGYKRHTPSNAERLLAEFLQQQLTSQGHDVFIDLSLRSGDNWLNEIDSKIKQADFFIALLSQHSVHSEMLHSELHRAYQYRQQMSGKPFILPVRMDYEEMLPYQIDVFLNPFQYINWKTEADNQKVFNEIQLAIQGKFEPKNLPPLSTHSVESEQAALPTPAFDPRILKRLRTPGGALRLSDKFYVVRKEDNKLNEAVTDWGETVTIQAPRQAGKTSMLVRALSHAENEGLKTIFLDFQGIGPEPLQKKDSFLHLIAKKVAFETGVSEQLFSELWERDLLSQEKITALFNEVVLPKQENPLVLAIDEADKLLETDYYQDVFGLIRSWHNKRARNEEWEKLNIVLVISTEPYMLIDDISQSPFNVGLRLDLHDLKEPELAWLNKTHGSPLNDQELLQAYSLLGGQPYLLRKLFYELVKEKTSFSEICQHSREDEGPFGDHLRRHLWQLKDKKELSKTLLQIIKYGHGDDDQALLRLSKVGLIRQTSNGYQPRCNLYADYYGEKL